MAELFLLQGLAHRFADGGDGLVGIDLRLEDGEFLVLSGRNGSGKTLLARHLAGLSLPSEGSLLFRGIEAASRRRELRRAVGFVFQDSDSQIIGQSVAEDAAFGPANLGLETQEIQRRVRRALDWAKLTGKENRRPETLSGGERRKLAIAGVLAMEPECLILDEPFANLDMESVNEIAKICQELNARGITIIVLTHELEKILHLARRLLILDSGRLCFDGKPEELEPEAFARHGLACPFEGHFPWTIPRPDPAGEKSP
jgi:biotin transport system ATP-binding protein